MDPAVPLLYDALEHDAELRGPLSEMRKERLDESFSKPALGEEQDGIER